jgi:GntR family transcriptional regulator, transcriptional repressor for pyruvate dehydrogenase complex
MSHIQQLIQSAPVRIPKTAELIADAVREEIYFGRLRPSDRLPNQAAMSAAFGASRPTVREALRILEAEELITGRRGVTGGAVVRIPSSSAWVRPAVMWLQARGDLRPGQTSSPLTSTIEAIALDPELAERVAALLKEVMASARPAGRRREAC